MGLPYPRGHGDAKYITAGNMAGKGRGGGYFQEAGSLRAQTLLGATALRDCSSATILSWPL